MKAVRKEKRNGRDVRDRSRLPTLPDDVVMNGIMYPADEIEKTSRGWSAPRRLSAIQPSTASSSQLVTLRGSISGGSAHGMRTCDGRKAASFWTRCDRRRDGEPIRRRENEFWKRSRRAGPSIRPPASTQSWKPPTATFPTRRSIARDRVRPRRYPSGRDRCGLPEQGVAACGQREGRNRRGQGHQLLAEQRTSTVKSTGRVPALWMLSSAGNPSAPGERRESRDTGSHGLFRAGTSTNQKENDMPVTDEQFKALSDEVKTLVGRHRQDHTGGRDRGELTVKSLTERPGRNRRQPEGQGRRRTDGASREDREGEPDGRRPSQGTDAQCGPCSRQAGGTRQGRWSHQPFRKHRLRQADLQAAEGGIIHGRYSKIYLGPARKNDPQVFEAEAVRQSPRLPDRPCPPVALSWPAHDCRQGLARPGKTTSHMKGVDAAYTSLCCRPAGGGWRPGSRPRNAG